MSEVARIVVGAVVGVVVGYTGHTLTFLGRIDAVEKSLTRIEARLDTMHAVPAK